MDIFLEADEDLEGKFLMKKYDYGLRRPVPYDLTTLSDIRLVVYERAPSIATLKLTDKQGRNHEIQFPLTEDQAEHYNKIDPRLRVEYLKILAEERHEVMAYLKKIQKDSN